MSYMMYAPARVLFGAGQLSRLHEQALPGNKALPVISSGKSVRENGALDRTLEELAHAGSGLFCPARSGPILWLWLGRRRPVRMAVASL